MTDERSQIYTSLTEREKEVKELTKQVSSLRENLSTEQRKWGVKIEALREVFGWV